jgi:hypothetical protein
MKDFKILKFMDIFRTVFEKLGYNYFILRKILQLKLTMDGRRTSTVFNNNKKNSAESNNNFFRSLGIYLLMGLMLIPFVLMNSNYMFQMSIIFAIIMFFIMTSLISDFSAVLLDIKDRNIMETKPVSPKTLRLAKTLHVSYYMFTISFVLSGPALIVSLLKNGPLFFLIFIVSIIFMDMFCIVLTSFIYFLVLRFFDGEKLKDIINYVQIVLSLVIMIGYQLVSRLFNIVDLNVTFVPKWWQYLLVPVWFSAPFQMLKTSEVTSTYINFTALAIIVPIFALTLHSSVLSHFEQYLLKLSNNSAKQKKETKKPSQFLTNILCRSREERTFFRFASDMMKNEREFKLKVYPSLGFAIAFPFIFLIQNILDSGIGEVSKGRSYFFIYFCGMILPSVLLMVRYSSAYKGAWIYKTLPISNVTPVFRGTMKALLIRLFFPFFLLESIIFTAIFGVRILPDLLIMLLNMLLMNILYFKIDDKYLPFSESFEDSKQGNVALNLLLMFGLAILAGLHYLSLKINYGIYVYFVIAFILNVVLWKNAFNINIKKLNRK